MTIIAAAGATSSAPTSEFFALWADMETWPEWNTDTEWVRLDGPFEPGATGWLKPKGGPKVRFRVDQLTDDRFLDVSMLPGARLSFDHRIERQGGRTSVSVEVSISGPLRLVWTALLGRSLRRSVSGDMAGLVAAAEAKATRR